MPKKSEKIFVFSELRKLINDGFKEYDGDIREEALEKLQEAELLYCTVKDQNDVMRNNNDDLYDENIGAKLSLCHLVNRYSLPIDEDKLLKEIKTIDFGIGKLFFHIEKESPITIKELMDTINECALIVPLPEIIKAIKKII